ncbi:hypothetical protein E3N88_20388 [Mikania micrantha]|uniref:Integrase catalytic domain-containing protein n=1 Tax=Mikania micrantha TaxID=192012 RepID=A0A5N6NJF7_9ASTR|nr:hypothetical protein E3N88_20388 [Mikania micrantha]
MIDLLSILQNNHQGADDDFDLMLMMTSIDYDFVGAGADAKTDLNFAVRSTWILDFAGDRLGFCRRLCRSGKLKKKPSEDQALRAEAEGRGRTACNRGRGRGDEEFRHLVKLGNDLRLNVKGIGDVRLEIEGIVHLVSRVYYIRELKSNLLSVGQLQEKGITVTIGVEGSYYKMEDENEQMWPKRLGHINNKTLRTMQFRGLVKGLPRIGESSKVCEVCNLGKHQRAVIPKKRKWRATMKLELVHTDLCGPITPESIGGKWYVMVLIDIFLERAGYIFLSKKSESFETFKSFKTMVETETDLKIKCLRSDRGGEFTSLEFNSYCENSGIKRQLTTSYTPQQNGVTEHRNKTLMNMVRCMLLERNMIKQFWPEATNWACFLLNRCGTTSVEDKVPEECWLGHNPNMEFVKNFGFQQRVIISKDVVFSENESWTWNKEQMGNLELMIPDEEGEMELNYESSPQHEEESAHEEPGPSVRPVQRMEGPSGEEPTVQPLNQPGRRDLRQKTDFAMYSSTEDPSAYDEAAKEPKWVQAMDRDMESILKNKTWEMVDKPKGIKPIGVRWIYTTKYNEKGQVDKYKARLVVEGYSQRKGIYYNEVYAPVARWDTVRSIVAIAAQKVWKIM